MRNTYSSSNTVGSGGGGAILSSTLSSLTSSSSSSSSVNPSPSFARRRALKEADAANQLRVVDCYPLSKYMAITQRLFGYFEQAFECLHLDEAYVYGMRFAQLALTNLPKHREWVTATAAAAAAVRCNSGGEGITEEENLKSQIVKVLSRLEIIKRRMDEEESMKLRTRMLAQAEEEERMQNQFNRERREQQQRNALLDERNQPPTIQNYASKSRSSAISQQTDTTITHTTEDDLREIVVPAAETRVDNRKSALGKSAKSKLRQFLRIPKKVESKSKSNSNNDIENSSLSSGCSKNSSQQPHVSQPIVPSLSVIRQSRAQYRQQQQQQQQYQNSIIIDNKSVVRTNDPGIVEPIPTHYTIEQYPIANEVTLKLQSNQTPSLLKLQSDHHYNTCMNGGDIIQQKYQIVHKEKDGVNKGRTSLIHSPSTVVVTESVLPLPLSSSQPLPDVSIIGSVLSHTAESLRINPHTKTISSADMSDEEIDMTLSDAFDGIQQVSKDTDANEVEEIIKSSLSSSSSSPEIVDTKDRVLVGITHRLLSIHREKDVNKHELVLNEMREKISCMYVGHHVIFEQSYKNDDDDDDNNDDDDDDRSIENDKKNVDDGPSATKFPKDNNNMTTIFALGTNVHPEDDVKSKKIKNLPTTNNNCTKNYDLLNSFDAFDNFISKNTQIDEEEESYMEFTVIEEECTEIEEVYDAELVEFTDRTEAPITEEEEKDAEEEEDGSYMEYTVIEDDLQSTGRLEKVEAAKALLDDLTGSPKCVTSDKVVHPYTMSSPSDQVHEQKLQNGESLDKFLTMSIAVSPAIIDDDDMTYITMDPYFEENGDNSSSSQNYHYQTKSKTIDSYTTPSEISSSDNAKKRLKPMETKC